MNFLVDAPRPSRLALALAEFGHDAIHTLDLPDRNATADTEVARRADEDDRIVVTKDGDFPNDHVLLGRPRRVLHVTTGNIVNADLLELVRRALPSIEHAFAQGDLVELNRTSIVVHDTRR